MFNPGDNKAMHCFVKENKIDNDFKLTMYPRWNRASYRLSNEICKTKEIYYKLINDTGINSKIQGSELERVKLHHDLAELTDKWIEESQKVDRNYWETLMEILKKFECSLDEKPVGSTDSITAANISKSCTSYVDKAEKERNVIFESFQKNLVDGLLWEHTTRANRRVETGQTSVGESTVDPVNTLRVEPHRYSWSDYTDMKFISSKSAVDEKPSKIENDNPQTETNEEDDQVPSVN